MRDVVLCLHVLAVCPPSTDLMWIVLAVTGCIVALGLIILCSWKIFITVHDRREYASFENEVKARREMVGLLFLF